MLAEELMQFAQRTSLETGASEVERFITRPRRPVLCRLARLHEDADYRQVAVIAVSLTTWAMRSAPSPTSRVPTPTTARTRLSSASRSVSSTAWTEGMKLRIADFRVQIEFQNYRQFAIQSAL